MQNSTNGAPTADNHEESTQSALATSPGAHPDTSMAIVSSVTLSAPIIGAGEADAPGVLVTVDLTSQAIPLISSVRVTLESPTGRTATFRAKASDNDNLEVLLIELDEYDPSGEWHLASVRISFDPELAPDTADLVLESDQLSSLMSTRFIELEVPQADITPPSFSDIDLPSRSFTIGNDNPFSSGGQESVEITFDMTVSDPASGLNIIEFEFDIGPGSPAVVGGEFGLLGDIRGGNLSLSTFNTRAPAGDYVLTRLRVSDDQGNTQLLTTDDLREAGYETIINVADRSALDDPSAPTVSSFSFDQSVQIDGSGGSVTLSFTASDNGQDDSGIHSASLVLRSATGGLYQLNAAAVMNQTGTAGTATFEFENTFPGGSFTVERLTLNDHAFNRAGLALTDTSFTVENSLGGNANANRIVGDDGHNTISARAGNDLVIAGKGNDNALLGAGNDTLWAGAGDQGDDTIIGAEGDDLIGGGGGNDLIIGGKVNDSGLRNAFSAFEERLDGADTLYGGAGDDTIHGGNPVLDGDNNRDDAAIDDYGSSASNKIYGGTGNDLVFGSRGSDVIGGGQGDDTVYGEDGHDIIFGGQNDGNDTGLSDWIYAGDGNDQVFASGGHDVVYGGADADTLYGGAGDDTLNGDGGHDNIYGGSGDDVMTGGTGNDTFFFPANNGEDVIRDYGNGQDTLFLGGYGDVFDNAAQVLLTGQLTTIRGETGILLSLDDDNSIFLVGVTNLSSIDVVV